MTVAVNQSREPTASGDVVERPTLGAAAESTRRRLP